MSIKYQRKMLMNRKPFLLIVISGLTIVLIIIGTGLMLRRYSSFRTCNILAMSITTLQHQSSLPNQELAQKMKNDLNDQLSNLSDTIEKLHSIADNQIIDSYKNDLQNTITTAQGKLDRVTRQLAQTDKQLLDQATHTINNTSKQLDLYIKQKQDTIKKLQKIKPQNESTLTIKKIQFSISKLQKERANQQKQLQQPKDKLLLYYKNDLEEHQIRSKKRIATAQRKVKLDKETLLKEATTFHKQKITTLKQVQSDAKAQLQLNDSQLAEMAKQKAERNIIDLKLKALEAHCSIKR